MRRAIFFLLLSLVPAFCGAAAPELKVENLGDRLAITPVLDASVDRRFYPINDGWVLGYSESGQVRLYGYRITITAIDEPAPTPPKPPPPPVPPTPPPPVLTGLAAKVLDWSTSLVPADSRVDGAKRLASAYQATIQAIDAKQVLGPTIIAKRIYDETHNAMPADLAKWMPVILQVATYCDEESKARRLVTPAQYRQMCADVIKGLNEVK